MKKKTGIHFEIGEQCEGAMRDYGTVEPTGRARKHESTVLLPIVAACAILGIAGNEFVCQFGFSLL